MHKGFKILICILLITLSIGIIFFTINNKKEQLKSNNVPNNDIIEITNNSLSITETIIVSVSLVILFVTIVYSLLSIIHINLFNFLHQLKYIIILILLSFTTNFLLIYYINYHFNHYYSTEKNYSSDIVIPSGMIELYGTKAIDNENYYNDKNNEAAILVRNNSNITLNNSFLTKYGKTSNIELANKYGINASILVLKDATLNIQNSTINSNGIGAIGLIASLNNANINVSKVSINTIGSNSSALVTSFGGNITGTNLTINTWSLGSAALVTYEDSNITVSDSVIKTNGSNAPIIYSKGNVTLETSNVDSNASYIGLIENNGKVRIRNCDITASALKYENLDDAGILIRKTTNSNSDSAYVNIYNSSLQIKDYTDAYRKAPLFNIINNSAVISIEDSDLIFGSNILLKIKNIDNDNVVTLNAKNQQLEGKIVTDKNTNLNLNFTNTNFIGSINSDNNTNNLSLVLDKDSFISLTSDSYIGTIEDELESFINIKTNGYTLYYSIKLNPHLEGKTIILDNNGKLKGI